MKRILSLLLTLLLALGAIGVAEEAAGTAAPELAGTPGAEATAPEASEPPATEAPAEATEAPATGEGADEPADDGAGMEAIADVPLETSVAVTLDQEGIRMLQLDLLGGGYLKGDADGIMGPATQRAVLAAQADLGLPENGVVSAAFLEALRAGAFPLEEDDRNSFVYEVQELLFIWGYMDADPTGFYGRNTESAAARFQRENLQDFVALRQAEVDAAYAEMAVEDDVVIDLPLVNADDTPCDGVITREWYDYLMAYEYPAIVCKPGDEGDSVKSMQKRLHVLGYMYTSLNGKFGDVTTLALKYFQRRNGLPETGSCDEATSQKLFSRDAVRSDEYVMPYMAYVKRSKSHVYIFGWDGAGYNTEVIDFECSCGSKSNPTIEGTFYAVGPIAEWYYMQSSNTWVRYAFQIQGNYFFHSVLFNYKGATHPTSSSLYNLGRNVSHGCIRLAVEDCKWIYDNCTAGMKVVIE